MFKKAERKKAKLRLALCGPSGSGKTYSALQIARGLGGKIAFIDTENGSGELYSHLCEYDICQISAPYAVQKYISAIKEAENAGYETIIIDSLTHAWAAEGGLLDIVDKKGATEKNSFAAWRHVTPLHNSLVDALLQSKCNIIATMRSKVAYEIREDSRGKKVPIKLGLAPVQREGLDYEFTVVMDIAQENHTATVSKDRTGLFDGEMFIPDPEIGERIKAWLESGVDARPAEKKSGTTEEEILSDLASKIGLTVEEDVSEMKSFLTNSAATKKQDFADFCRACLSHIESFKKAFRDHLKKIAEANKKEREAAIQEIVAAAAKEAPPPAVDDGLSEGPSPFQDDGVINPYDRRATLDEINAELKRLGLPTDTLPRDLSEIYGGDPGDIDNYADLRNLLFRLKERQ